MSASSRRPIISKAYEKYFEKTHSLGEKTLQRLHRGVPCDSKTIQDFASPLRLKATDRAELFIRWGECKINRYAFKVLDNQMRSFVRSWRDLPYQTVQDLQIEAITRLISPRASLILGITVCLEHCCPSLKSIESVPYSTLARSARKGTLSPKTLNKFLNELQPKLPGSKATQEELVAHYRLQLTLEKLCADYIESQVYIRRRLLDLKLHDLRKSFDPQVHVRLAAWLVRVCLPVQFGSLRIEPLYFS